MPPTWSTLLLDGLRRARGLIAAVLALCLPLQGLQMVVAQAAVPAHFHTERAHLERVEAAPTPGGATSYDRLAVALAAMAVQSVQTTALSQTTQDAEPTTPNARPSAHAASHRHVTTAPHTHALATTGVVYLPGEAQAPGAPRGSAKLPLGDGALRSFALDLPALQVLPQRYARAAGKSFRSHVDAPPHRPPRATRIG